MRGIRRGIWLFGCVPVILAGSLIALMFLGQRLVTSDRLGDVPAFYAAASLVDAAPAAAYDSALLNPRIAAHLGEPLDGKMFWHYPPTGFFVVEPLGWVSFTHARWVWTGLNLGVFAAGLFVLGGRDARALLVLAAPSVVGVLLMGQNGLLNAGLLALALAFTERSPGIAGGWLAVLSYKPHAAVPLLAAWTLQPRARALGAYLLVLAALVALSFWAYGVEVWGVFARTLLDAVLDETGLPARLSDRNVSLFVMLRDLFASSQVAAAGVAAVACPVLILLGRTRGLSPTDPYVVLMVVTALPLLSPKAMDYDMIALLLPLVPLGRRLITQGLAYSDMALVLFAWIAVPMLRFSDQVVAFQAWPLVWLALFVYAAYRSGALGAPGRSTA